MQSVRRRTLAFSAGVAVTSLVAVGLSLSPAAAEGTIVKQEGFATSGLLVLDASQVGEEVTRYSEVDGTISDSISEQCSSGSIVTDFVTISPVVSPDARQVKMGYDGEGIGVGERRDSGAGCYTADVYDPIRTAEVEGELTEYPAQGIRLDFAEGLVVGEMSLDVSFKGEPNFVAWGEFAGSPVGVSISGGPADETDNGPDCLGCDHYRVQLTPAAPIDAIVVAPAVGADGSTNTSTAAIALSGGYTDPLDPDPTDGDVTGIAWGEDKVYSGAGSVFELLAFDGTINCGETVLDGDVSLTHLGAGCTGPQLYLIERDANDTVLIALPNNTADAYVATIPFDNEPVTYAGDPAQNEFALTEKTTVDFLLVDGGGNPLPNSKQTLQFCSTVDGKNYKDDGDSVLSLPFDIIPGGEEQGVCRIERTIQIYTGNDDTFDDGVFVSAGADRVTVIEKVLIVGDPAFGYN